MNNRFIRLILCGLIWVNSTFTLFAQQNSTMYFVPANPEVNSLNPAFQNTCKLFIGLPVISSIHLNLNNTFSYNDLLKEGNGYNYIRPSQMNLGNVPTFNGEVYTNLVVVGVWIKRNYFTFSIIEKSDFALFYHRELAGLVFEGNTQYEGEEAKLKRTGVFFDYRREYALGIARKISSFTTLGIKGKLLFGKINASTRKSDTYLFTHPNTFDLTAHSDVAINTSAPVEVTTDLNGRPTDATYNGTPSEILFNRQNIGFAFDFGFIRKLNGKETLSGSVLDLGAIYYKTGINNFTAAGDYTYTGLTTTTNSLRTIIDSTFRDFTTGVSHNPYIVFLPPRVYFSYSNQITPKTAIYALATSKFYRYKMLPGYTIGGSHQLVKHIYLAASWSYMNRTLKNIGTGVVIGRNPVQFYAFTDNILTAFNPLSSRNLNLRFGINLIFGCSKKENYKKSGCEWIQKAEQKQERLQQIRNK